MENNVNNVKLQIALNGRVLELFGHLKNIINDISKWFFPSFNRLSL